MANKPARRQRPTVVARLKSTSSHRRLGKGAAVQAESTENETGLGLTKTMTQRKDGP